MHPELFSFALSPWLGLAIPALGALAVAAAFAAVSRWQGEGLKKTLLIAPVWGLLGFLLLRNLAGASGTSRVAVPAYWVLDVSAFGLLIALCLWTATRKGLSPRPLLAAAPLYIGTSLLLSRLLFLARDRFYHQPSPVDSVKAFLLSNQGANTFMVVLGTTLGLTAYLSIKGLPRLPYLDVLYANAPLGLGLAKLGCFSAGCCWGLRSDSPLAVAFPPGSPAFRDQSLHGLIAWDAPAALPVLPVQLFETASMVLLWAALRLVSRRPLKPGQLSCLFLFGYALVQATMETMRGDPHRGGPVWGPSTAFYNISMQHMLSFEFMLAAVVTTLWLRRSWQKQEVAA